MSGLRYPGKDSNLAVGHTDTKNFPQRYKPPGKRRLGWFVPRERRTFKNRIYRPATDAAVGRNVQNSEMPSAL